jgi:cytochrome P450
MREPTQAATDGRAPSPPPGSFPAALPHFQVTELPAPRWGLSLVEALRRDTLGAWAAIHRHGDVVRTRVLGRTFYFIFDPALMRAALMEHDDAFHKEARQTKIFRLGQGVNVLTTEGTDWKRQRRILNPAFAPRKVEGYLALMAQAMAEVNADMLPQQAGQHAVLDVQAYTTRLTMDVILRVLFGERMDKAGVQGASDAIHQLEAQGMRMMFWPWIPPQWLPFPGKRATRQASDLLRGLVRGHIEARRSPGATQPARTDLLATMLLAEDEAPDSAQDAAGQRHLSTQEVEDNCMALFLAGHDTSATALTWWMGLMAEHPQAAERAREEVRAVWGEVGGEAGLGRPSDAALTPEQVRRMPWLEATLKEAMRLRPAIAAPFMRQAQKPVNIQGLSLQPGDCVSMPIWEVQRDARLFPEPEAFRPERFLPGAPEIPRGAWMPFGAGPHVCIGQHFAMMEMMLIAATLVDQYRWCLEPGDSLPKPHMAIVVKPERVLRLRIWLENARPASVQTGA